MDFVDMFRLKKHSIWIPYEWVMSVQSMDMNGHSRFEWVRWNAWRIFPLVICVDTLTTFERGIRWHVMWVVLEVVARSNTCVFDPNTWLSRSVSGWRLSSTYLACIWSYYELDMDRHVWELDFHLLVACEIWWRCHGTNVTRIVAMYQALGWMLLLGLV